MVTENDVLPLEKPRSLHIEWVIPTIFRPRRTLEQATEPARSTWQTPLLILTILAVALVLIAGPLRATAAANGTQSLPPDFQYWSPEQQSQYMQSRAAASGIFFTHVLPGLGDLLRIWVGWFLIAGVLHLALTLSGSRTDLTHALNLVGWASLPFAIRYLVQIGSLLFTHQLIASPGLSGFAPAGTSFLAQYASAILPLIDIYLVWMVILILVGVRTLPGMTTGKALVAILVTLLIVLLVEALPGFLKAKLGGLSTGGNRFFFF